MLGRTGLLWRTVAAVSATTTGPVSSSSATPPQRAKDQWENLQGLLAVSKFTHPVDVFHDRPLAIGSLVKHISGTAYKVKFRPPPAESNGGLLHEEDSHPPLTLDVGTRVKIPYGSHDIEMLLGGSIAKVNGNGTYTMLMTNDEIELSVSPVRIAKRDGGSKVYRNAKFIKLVDWLRSSIRDPRDCEALGYILFRRGWRTERLYLVEKGDLSPMVFVSKLEIERLMEKARGERDHHNVIRLLRRERVKDRDFRYALSKYKGTLSCITGICVVTYVFFHNLRAYRKQQRSYQLQLAVNTLVRGRTSRLKHGSRPSVYREEEEGRTRRAIQQLDTAHPRIIVFTGFSGCGKSTVCRAAIVEQQLPALYVDVRSNEDTLNRVVKALGVQNVEACGDLLDFVAEACLIFRQQHKGATPLLVLNLRGGSTLKRVYNEAVALACDRRVCHLIMEVPVESLTMANVSLPLA